MTSAAIKTLCDQIVDYAGLFPPAKLDMSPAVEAYAREKVGLHRWMLGRFVCPASRLAELSRAGAALMPGTFATSGYREYADSVEPWRITVLADSVTAQDPVGGLERDIAAIIDFNTRHATEDQGLAQADCIELKPPTPDFVDEAAELIPEDLYPFFELPGGIDPRGFVAALAGAAAGAKIRTGGTTPEAFPSAEVVAEFIRACVAAEVPFKATAGLHHPLRGSFPLTYEKGSACAEMFGFLNVFVTAALAKAHRLDTPTLVQCLTERDPSSIAATDDGLRWRKLVLSVSQLSAAREGLALSFGSCSFDEPVRELTALGLL